MVDGPSCIALDGHSRFELLFGCADCVGSVRGVDEALHTSATMHASENSRTAAGGARTSSGSGRCPKTLLGKNCNSQLRPEPHLCPHRLEEESATDIEDSRGAVFPWPR